MDQLNNLSIQEEEAISPLPLSALPDGDPQMVYHSANTTIYSLNDIGYKVLNNCPSDEAFIKLTHEQNTFEKLVKLMPGSSRSSTQKLATHNTYISIRLLV